MIRINLLPPEERASIKAINTNAILLSCGIVLIALMLFSGVYLRLQIMWENDKLVGYQEAVANMSHYRTAIARMEKQMKALEKQIPKKPIFKYCPHCSGRVMDYAEYCYKCGQKIDWEGRK